MKRRVVAAAIFVALAASTASAQSRPNVILIYGDDLGYGDVSAHGALRLKTPNIDRLAGEGLRLVAIDRDRLHGWPGGGFGAM